MNTTPCPNRADALAYFVTYGSQSTIRVLRPIRIGFDHGLACLQSAHAAGINHVPRTFVDVEGLPLGLWVHVIQSRYAKGALSSVERDAFVRASGALDVREQQFIDGLTHIRAHTGAKAAIGADHICDDGFPLSNFVAALSDSVSIDAKRRGAIAEEVLGVRRLSDHRFFRTGAACLKEVKADANQETTPGHPTPAPTPYRLDGVSDQQYLNLYASWVDRHPERVEVPTDEMFAGVRLGAWFSSLSPKRQTQRAVQLRSMITARSGGVRFLDRTSIEETRVRQAVKRLRAFAVAGSPKPEVVRHIGASVLMTTPLSTQDEADIEQAGFSDLVNHLRKQGAAA